MDDTINQLTPAAKPMPVPASSGTRWNGWLLLVTGIVGIFTFFAAQTIVFAIIFFKAHPSALTLGVSASALSQNGMIDLLTAKNLWYISVISELVLAVVTLVLAR